MLIQVPDVILTSHSHLLYTSSYSSSSSHELSVGVTQDMLILLARNIIHEELDYLEKIEPDFDLVKMQQMLNGDLEMRELAYTALEHSTVYTVPLLKAIHSHQFNKIEGLLTEYASYVKHNLLLRPLSLWTKNKQD